MFRGMADATIKVFVPLLILKATGSLMLSFVYLVVNYFIASVLFFALKKFIQKYMFLCLILSIIPIVAGAFLLTIEINIWIVLVLALLYSVSDVLYYGGLNLIFATFDSKANMAKFEAGSNLGRIIFCLLSAYVLGNVANSTLFVVLFSLLFYALSIVPIIFRYKKLKFLTKDIPVCKTKDVMKDTRVYNIYHCFTGIFQFFVEAFLPLYLYVNGLTFSVVGYLVAIQYVVVIIAGYFAKFLVDKKQINLNVILGSILLLGSLIAIMLTKNVKAIYALTIVISFGYNMLFQALFSKFILEQKQKGFYYDSILYRDVFQNGARVIASATFLIFSNYIVMFALGIASSIGIGVSSIFCAKNGKNNKTDEKPIEEKSHENEQELEDEK